MSFNPNLLGGFVGNSVILATLLALSHGTLKWVSAQPHEGFFELLWHYWWQIGLALSVYGFLFFYYFYILRWFDIAVLYSVYTGLAILFVALLGVFHFGEQLSTLQMIGCALIVGGVVLMGQGA